MNWHVTVYPFIGPEKIYNYFGGDTTTLLREITPRKKLFPSTTNLYFLTRIELIAHRSLYNVYKERISIIIYTSKIYLIWNN